MNRETLEQIYARHQAAIAASEHYVRAVPIVAAARTTQIALRADRAQMQVVQAAYRRVTSALVGVVESLQEADDPRVLDALEGLASAAADLPSAMESHGQLIAQRELQAAEWSRWARREIEAAHKLARDHGLDMSHYVNYDDFTARQIARENELRETKDTSDATS